MSSADNDNHARDDLAPLKISGAGSSAASRKRFYQAVTIGPAPSQGFSVLLDGRLMRTPARRVLELPAKALARAVAEEWDAQASTIDPRTMPLTRLVNSAIDGVSGREAEVTADIVKYAGSDLLCYRADRPPGLAARQAELWDPVLAWASAALPGHFAVATGVIHVAQDVDTTARLGERLGRLDGLSLAAVHVMTTLSGSAVLAYACLERQLPAERAWALAHVDEDWQIAEWGEDAEATARRQARWVDFSAADRLLRLLHS